MLAKVYLIPTTISETEIESTSPFLDDVFSKCSHFFVEHIGRAVRSCKKKDKYFNPQEKQWYALHKKEQKILAEFSEVLAQGQSIAIMSDAGCPCIADPGHALVKKAHEMNAQVIPLAGSSAIILALMASGLNGQSFCFHGYLPIPSNQRKKAIIQYENTSKIKNGTAQIFIETPYRNQALFEDLLRCLKSATLLSIAVGVLSDSQLVKTQSVAEWKRAKFTFQKQPAIFIFQSS